MAHTANPSVPEHGKFRRALAAVWATLEAMSSSSGFDYTLDRIERLEREVGRLREEMRQSREPGPIHSHNDSAAAPKP
jgi:HAMP domain-containing protein